MEFDLARLTPKERYKLLSSTVTPRPIALISTIDTNGVLNAAPFSFFNVFAEDPATCVIGLARHDDGSKRDTARLIEEQGEFVVNMVDMDIVDRMNICAIDFEPGVDEFERAGFTPAPSRLVAPPRIAESPVSLECRRTVTLQLSKSRDLVVAEILTMHARDGLIDPDRLYLDGEKYRPVGRLYADLYATVDDTFSKRRWQPDEWEEAQEDLARSLGAGAAGGS
ncbi:flavin reductase family protein [Oceanicola sp. D3]|uniref:flavin reductase family protein n=1 Tax=Oceanicola sp. D3 TaxID=2587163 RepID=UPI00111FDE11|nr:flavin reductase family protein [Oceanicola sp. D3]QDC08702.1 flavin reductase family protein [Oceanicola sp. D3]